MPQVKRWRAGPLVIAISAGKGGTGKTMVAVNLALSLHRRGERVVLLDADVEEPNAHLFLHPTFTGNTACLNKWDINPSMAKAIRRLCGKAGIRMVAEIPFREEVVEALRSGLLPFGALPREVEDPLNGLAGTVKEAVTMGG